MSADSDNSEEVHREAATVANPNNSQTMKDEHRTTVRTIANLLKNSAEAPEMDQRVAVVTTPKATSYYLHTSETFVRINESAVSATKVKRHTLCDGSLLDKVADPEADISTPKRSDLDQTVQTSLAAKLDKLENAQTTETSGQTVSISQPTSPSDGKYEDSVADRRPEEQLEIASSRRREDEGW